MPELCRFYGIIIGMFWEDPSTPTLSRVLRKQRSAVDILTAEIIAGSLPLGARSLVRQWTELHR
jgi:hypothetical protein